MLEGSQHISEVAHDILLPAEDLDKMVRRVNVFVDLEKAVVNSPIVPARVWVAERLAAVYAVDVSVVRELRISWESEWSG
jgi:hypothetical protein